ncbi:hypothetical protein DXG01_001807 [Tephrocybe rancida]|nr:hypothetical protein DXG01_001807 [Tephrocybe rancida]
MSLLILSSTDVSLILSSLSPSSLQSSMARVFHLISSPPQDPPLIDTPHRTSIPMANHTALFMPARGLGETTLKVVSVPRRGEGGIPGSTVVMDERTGVVKAMVNARSLTPFRNAAADSDSGTGSLLSARIVRLTDPTSLVAFGSGSQIHAHLSLFTRSYPTLKHITLAVRSPNARSSALAQSFSSPSLTVTVLPLSSPELQTAVSSAQLIICATSATDPLFPSSWVRNGTHVILIGSYTPSMREVERALVLRASKANALLVDSKEACAIEAGELIEAEVGPEDVREIGECVLGFGEGGEGEERLEFVSARGGEGGEEGEDEITMFKSVGVGLQDVAIACEVVRRAEEMGIGTRVENYDL